MKILAISLIFCLALSSAATAGQNIFCKVGIHIEAHNAKRSCASLPVIGNCADIATTYVGTDFDAMPVFFELYGITGAEYGLTWPAWTYSCAFTNCSDLVIGNIAWPGAGISHTWNTCQVRYAVICGWGWFYADGPGMLDPIPHPDTGFMGVTDCDFQADAACPYFSGVGGLIGDDPCMPSPVEPATWGGIKSMLR